MASEEHSGSLLPLSRGGHLQSNLHAANQNEGRDFT
jgi:hypothetical protein